MFILSSFCSLFLSVPVSEHGFCYFLQKRQEENKCCLLKSYLCEKVTEKKVVPQEPMVLRVILHVELQSPKAQAESRGSGKKECDASR